MKITNSFLFYCLILFGLSRFLFLNSWGIVDSEWWRAWISHLNLVGFANLYSNPTQGIGVLKALGNPISVDGAIVTFPFISIPTLVPNDYFRQLFPIAQPPIFFLDLAFVSTLKKSFNVESDYFILNFTNILFSIILTIVVTKILKYRNVSNHQIWGVALIWANPLLILQANVQGYRDLLLLILITLSFQIVLKSPKHAFPAGIIFGLACLTKPTAVYLLIIIFIIMANKEFFKYVMGMLFATSIVLAAYLVTNRIYGLIAAIFTEFSFTKTFSEGISFWSPIKLIYDHSELLPFSVSMKENLFEFSKILAINLNYISLLHIFIFTLAASKLRRLEKIDVFDVRIQMFTLLYYFFIPNSRMNHYFVFITIWLIAIPIMKKYLFSGAIIFLLFIQDFLYGGFGRNSLFEGTKFSLLVNILFSAAVLLYFVRKKLKTTKLSSENPE